MAAKIHNFATALPQAIYWDASFIVHFASKNAKYFDDCQKFYWRLNEESIPSFISTLSLDETWFILLQAKIEEDNSTRTFWQAYNDNPKVILQYLPLLEELYNRLVTQPHITIIGTEASYTTDVLSKMKTYYFLPRDAYHLTIMDFYKIRCMATTDKHFSKVSDIEIYTCNPTILQQSKR